MDNEVMAENKVHTLHITNAGALALHSICKDVKWYTEPMELMHAGAIRKLVEKKLPQIKKLDEFKPVEGVDGWLEKPFTLKLYEDMRETAKKSVLAHIKLGAFQASDGISLLVFELGLGTIPNIDALFVEEEAPAASASA